MIHTTHRKAIDAYAAINRILQMPFRMGDARKITMMKIALDSEAQFNDQEVHKLFSRYHCEAMKDGRYKFESTEERDAFEQNVSEMDKIEFDINEDPVTISLCMYDSDDIVITQGDISALEGFIEFTE